MGKGLADLVAAGALALMSIGLTIYLIVEVTLRGHEPNSLLVGAMGAIIGGAWAHLRISKHRRNGKGAKDDRDAGAS